MKNRIMTGLLLLACYPLAQAQTVLADYVKKGIDNNLGLQQKNMSLQKATLALKQARRLFAPSINLMADYQSGEGGRSIGLPVGDLLNPVYSTLNQLTQSASFPQIENVSTYFFPKNFYDTKLRTAMPLLNSDLVYNKKIQEEKLAMTTLEAEVYKRNLVKDIQVAYYQYLSASEAVLITTSAVENAEQHQKQTARLIGQGLVIAAADLRTRSEVLSMQAKLAEAQQQQKNAASYFNFLINAPLDAAIIIDSGAVQTTTALLLADDNAAGYKRRPELEVVKHAVAANQHYAHLQRDAWLPRLNAFVDLGSQASDFKFNDKSRYYFFGVSLNMPLFAAGKLTLAARQAKFDLSQMELQQAELDRQLQLSYSMSVTALRTAQVNARSAALRRESAQSYYNLLSKGYKQGSSTYIELIDAGNQLLSARLAAAIANYQVQIATINYNYEINQ